MARLHLPLYVTLIVAVILVICLADTRIKINYPSHWYQSRTDFGFPFHFKSFYMPCFNDWKTSSPTLKSWQYLSTANYEIPRYVKEGHWIPNSFKSYCVPEAGSKTYADLIWAFTNEDYSKDTQDSIRQQFTLTGKYYDQGYFTILYFLLNVCQCLRKRYTDRHCPNPCWRPNVCTGIPYSTGVCHVIRNTEMRTQIHHRLRSKLRDIYELDYQCECESGYQFNRTQRQCVRRAIECHTGDCYNGGICEVLHVYNKASRDMSYKCHCPPAWQGPMCEVSSIVWCYVCHIWLNRS
ncbi:hypothetical protein PHET_05436 [Paragonimus heterotremus]|uniref:EGF-like domain-containing protein n=1 Tax=Paragonimus heterotremus TaxID=100268 RepID=A0A8J4WHW5_9TREM|nr:hypothetical protein PHET_05436 [Paragonimus heterotremus]